MQTIHLKGRQLALFDAELSEHFGLTPGTEDSIAKDKLRIGIRNECGELYRLIGTSNTSEFLMIVERLQELGFADEIAGERKPVRHCHAILRLAHEDSPHT